MACSYDGLKKIFFPESPQGEMLLLLDGHSSHCGSVETLEYAVENKIVFIYVYPVMRPSLYSP